LRQLGTPYGVPSMADRGGVTIDPICEAMARGGGARSHVRDSCTDAAQGTYPAYARTSRMPKDKEDWQLGKDLFIDWRHYVLPPTETSGCTVLPRRRTQSLKGFQSRDSTAFQLAVRAAFEEAIDLAGISKALIQGLPKEEGEERRVT